MQNSLKKIAGILITLISFVLLIWCFLAHPYNLGIRMLINVAGFMGFAGGLYLAGMDLFRFGKPKEPYEREHAHKTEKKKETEKAELKNFEKDDHNKYMPK